MASDRTSPAVLRLVRSFIDDGKDVALLSRITGPVGGIEYADTTGGIVNPLDRL